MTNFDRLAPFYDNLKKLIFQSALGKAASCFIADIPLNSQILIIGGGTGALLMHFKKTHTITYIEQSGKMLSAAKKRPTEAYVEFICEDIIHYELQKEYDCIITPFVLDCFQEEQLKHLMSKLTPDLKNNGMWLHADFYPHNSMQKGFVQLMYFFFRKTAGLTLLNIPDFDQIFSDEKYIIKKNVRFKRGLIQSRSYRKIA